MEGSSRTYRTPRSLRADLRRQANALAFAAGERGGGAVEREVVEADGVEEFQALDDLPLQAVGDDGFAAGEVHGAGTGEGALQRERSEVGDAECSRRSALRSAVDGAPLVAAIGRG